MNITILYENEDWMPPLRAALENRDLSYQNRFVEGGVLNMGKSPAPQLVVNRMSPSSHTRGHQAGVRFVREYLWF